MVDDESVTIGFEKYRSGFPPFCDKAIVDTHISAAIHNAFSFMILKFENLFDVVCSFIHAGNGAASNEVHGLTV